MPKKIPLQRTGKFLLAASIDFLAFLPGFIKWIGLGGLIGILAGSASALFLASLDWATQTRLSNPQILYLLPLAGLAIGWVYHHFAGAAAMGNNLVIEEIHSNQARIPFRMSPLVLLGTLITHFFGGSAGREGTAVQMGASLADTLRRLLNLGAEDRRLMIMAGVSGGFGSVFGTPVAGFVFGMEVQTVGRIRYEGIVPCLVAAYIGDLVTRLWGVGHTHYPAIAHFEVNTALLLMVVLAGLLFGLASTLFVELTHLIKQATSSWINYPPLRPFFGGLVIVLLSLLLGTQDYLGLGIPLLQTSLSGGAVLASAFILKLIFTSITLGTGFLGGEVTPLFVIGATLGSSIGSLFGIDTGFMASIGFVSLFAAASNAPLASALMAIELFGGNSALYIVLGCMVAYLASGYQGIYATQRIESLKSTRHQVQRGETLQALQERRRKE